MIPATIDYEQLGDNQYFIQFVKFTQIINNELDLDIILQRGCDAICDLLHAKGCHIMLFKAIKEELSLATFAQTGDVKLPENIDEIINNFYEGRQIDQSVLKQPLIVNDSKNDPRLIQELVELLGHNSFIRVPIISGNEVIGTTNVYSEEYNFFDEQKVILLILLSDQLGIAINNSRIIKQLEAEKNLQNKLLQKEKELEQANYLLTLEEQIRQNEKFAVVGKLAAGLAHEIRNPMTSIKGFLQLIFGKIEDHTIKEYLSIVLEDIERINKLVTEFLLLSKPSAPKFAGYNVNEVISEVLDIMRSYAIENDIYIHEDLSSDLPSAYVDKEQYKQIIINIIRNAIEAIAGKGEINIYTEYLAREEMVRTTIKDNGPGISREIKSKIFDPFFTTKDEGTGLGLSVSYKIVESMHGRILVDSEEGKGTEIKIDMPVNI